MQLPITHPSKKLRRAAILSFLERGNCVLGSNRRKKNEKDSSIVTQIIQYMGSTDFNSINNIIAITHNADTIAMKAIKAYSR